MVIVLQFVDTTEETELWGLESYKKSNLFSATFFFSAFFCHFGNFWITLVINND